MKKRLLFLSIIEGAAVMAAELCGAKLLAPIFGSSLYVWATVMGITLAALALGYFCGGYLSRNKQKENVYLFYVLIAASVFMFAMPIISFYGVQRISYLPFTPSVIASTLSLLFLPVFFLGATSPLFISLQSKDQETAGRVSGTVYAVSTLGGIVSTFLCGFYLIPVIGLNACLFTFATVLLVSTLMVLKLFKSTIILPIAALMYLNWTMHPLQKNSLMQTDGILGHLEVKDISTGLTKYRVLSINAIVQTEMDLETKHSMSAYIRILDSLIPRSETPKQALVLGLGGGLTSNLLVEKNYQTEGVEFDQRIIEAGKQFFYLKDEVQISCADARYFLNSCKKKYDVVLFDVFKAEEQPSHVLTYESLIQLKSNLNAGAKIFINWHGYLHEEIGKGTQILYHTLKKSGYKVKLCSDSNLEDSRNIIMVVSLDSLSSLPFELNEAITQTNLVNTDDLPLMEKYNALANKTWRLHYLRYYQGLN